jgi:hypothetical protein
MRAWTAGTTLLLLFGPVACGGSGDPADDPDAGQSACEAPLDEETLATLRLGFEHNLAMRPGQVRTIHLGVVECCYLFEPIAACATFAVSPDDLATIDPTTGELEIHATASHGDVVTVTADVEDGRHQVTIDIHVYTPEENPLFGYWREAALLSCDDGEELPYHDRIEELRFRADGTVLVTWLPFEIYVDYWADYTYDLADGSLALQVNGGNYVPTDVGEAGTFSIDAEGRLILEDLWLGTASGSTADPACGHVFAR